MRLHGPPLYSRALRLRHLTLRPYLAFLFFEGSVGLGVLLALADITTGLAVIVIPVTVAVMVKINDIVAGGLSAGAVPAAATPGAAPVAIPRARLAPIRGASARRTREIVGRARLGTARGIVYVHPEPGNVRRPPVPGARPDVDDPAAGAAPNGSVRGPDHVEGGGHGGHGGEGGDGGDGGRDQVRRPPLGESPSGDIARDRADRNKGRFGG